MLFDPAETADSSTIVRGVSVVGRSGAVWATRRRKWRRKRKLARTQLNEPMAGDPCWLSLATTIASMFAIAALVSSCCTPPSSYGDNELTEKMF
jgi:hypothetical protein